MRIAKNLTELIGRTPLLELARLSEAKGLSVPVFGKLESFNPGGSMKDRPAYAMIKAAEASGLLSQGGTIIEPTSGNMGVGLAWVSAVLGYRMIVVMPETMSEERHGLVRAYGARLELSSGALGMAGAVARAEQLKMEIPGSIILGQFQNEANPLAHYHTTANEIWDDTDGLVDVVVAGVGTGGCISGIGKRLKELNPQIYIVAVEPASSPLLSEGHAGNHKIQGLGANFIPKTYHAEYVDEVVSISDDEAIQASRLLAETEGVLAGISSGAALCGAYRLATRSAYADKKIVALLPDTGERYLSTCEFDVDDYPLPSW